ncbi:MAG: hypothetical protein JW841_05640 [Deltaproteobacteria bacterium]|nr:hypothetical protein [Deltaproteobacteria bacterium]
MNDIGTPPSSGSNGSYDDSNNSCACTNETVTNDSAQELAAIKGKDPMPAVIVHFNAPGQVREFGYQDIELSSNTQVIVETAKGTRLGTVVEVCQRPADQLMYHVLRVATQEDIDAHHRNKIREREAAAFCVERIKALSLPMKLISVEFAHSGSSAMFNFVSDERVDFRTLVKDLARRFHTRIDMRQIGVRDAARLCGGVGVCGRELCCATYLCTFNPISVRMAKDQNLTLNQDKLSGICGRLKCCLAYEESTYAELRQGLPKLGKRVFTPEGEGRVKDVDVIRRLIRVQLFDGRYLEFNGDLVKRPSEASIAQTTRQNGLPTKANTLRGQDNYDNDSNSEEEGESAASDNYTENNYDAQQAMQHRRKRRRRDRPNETTHESAPIDNKDISRRSSDKENT